MKKKDKKKSEKPASEIKGSASDDAVTEKKSFIKKIFSLKFIIIFFVVLLIAGGAVFSGWFFFLKDKPSETGEVTPDSAQDNPIEQKEGEDVIPPEPDFPDIVDLEPFEKIRIMKSEYLNYITLKLSMELVKPELRQAFETNIELIRQTVEDEMTTMTWSMLRVPEGKLRLKYILIKKINSVLSSAMIRNVYFTEFILH